MNLFISKISEGLFAVGFTTLCIQLFLFLGMPLTGRDAWEKHQRHWINSKLLRKWMLRDGKIYLWWYVMVLYLNLNLRQSAIKNQHLFLEDLISKKLKKLASIVLSQNKGNNKSQGNAVSNYFLLILGL